ncbi:MAG: hypothetical protein ISP80_05535 [Synechococcus sp. BS301-5m-G53]|nr:hypothetical protein [Synechococcus sp. BS301-5m-G53]
MGLLQTLQRRLLHYDSPSRQLQQAHFDAARNLAQAQFQLADAELSQRLWQDVADRDLDVDRVLNLLYGCWFQEDPAELRAADVEFQARRERELVPGVFEHC